MTGVLPLSAARIRGTDPDALRTSRDPFRCRRASTTSACPAADAKCRGVFICLSRGLQSPPTSSETASGTLAHNALALFGLSVEQLDQRIPISVASAGSSHLVIALDAHSDLTAMSYELDEGKRLMDEHGLTTIALLHAEGNNRFCVRCAFASGGVHEDPATGSAAAALGGLLRDLGWPHAGRVEVTQGVDMGMPSKLVVEIGKAVGESVRVSGLVRRM